MNTCVASSSGSAPLRKRSAAGTPVLDARTSGWTSRKSFSRSGDRSPRSRSVGARSCAGSRRSRTSGSVLRAKSSSRRTVARVSRRKVGKTWKVSASASSREASAPKVASPFVIRPRSWPSSRDTAWKTRPVSRKTRLSATSCSASGRSRSAPPSKNGAALPSESLKSRAKLPLVTMPASWSHCWNALRVVGVEDAEDLVELDRVVHVRSRQRAAVGELLGARVARRELDVGLAQQALLAEDRARVAADRSEAVVQLHLHRRGAPAGTELLRLDLADVHARHPDVGLLHEQRGLREVRLEAIALGPERQRAAERRPQEHQQRRHGQREADHGCDASDAGRVLVHGSVTGRSGRIGRPPPLSGGGVVGRALKLQEPNCVLSSSSTGLEPPGPGVVSRSSSAGVARPDVADDPLDDARRGPRPGRRRS